MKKKIYAGVMGIIILLNIVSWRSTAFCDWFRLNVFHHVVGGYARFSNQFDFSLGEYMIYTGVVLVILAITGLLILLFYRIFHGNRRSKTHRVTVAFLKGFAWLFLVVSAVMTINCFVLYHCSSFRSVYMPQADQDDYSLKQLVLVRDYVISQANSLSGKMERDEKGNLVYDGDLKAQAILEMNKMGKEYSLLDGYYPRPKEIAASKFLSQQYMMGYYFPFSMEANYNGEMYLSNMPVTMCHELSHLQGFIYEDDANFIGYMACVRSDDPFFQYSGYLSVIDYLNADLYKSLDGDKNIYMTYRQCNSKVKHDKVFLTKDAWNMVEKSAVVKTSTLKKASNAFLTTNLNMNGVEDGLASYGNVVEYLLEYYSGTLY